MTLEKVALEGIILFRGNLTCNAEPVLFSLIRSDRKCTIVTIPGQEVVLRRRYPDKISDDTMFVFFDHSFSIKDIFQNIIATRPTFCIINCIDLLINSHNVDETAALLYRLKVLFPVASLSSSDNISEEEWARLSSISDTLFSLATRNDICVCDSVYYQRNGKIQSMTEQFIVDKDLKISSTKIEDPIEVAKKMDNDMLTPFNIGLNLKDTERVAREQLQLPYMSAKNQEGLVNLRHAERKIRVGGQVIYVPDSNDDLDDSDPDDDLNL